MSSTTAARAGALDGRRRRHADLNVGRGVGNPSALALARRRSQRGIALDAVTPEQRARLRERLYDEAKRCLLFSVEGSRAAERPPRRCSSRPIADVRVGNLAFVLQKQGKLDEAKAMLASSGCHPDTLAAVRRAGARRRERTTHPTLMTVGNLANVNNLDEANAMNERRSRAERTLGADHPTR